MFLLEQLWWLNVVRSCLIYHKIQVTHYEVKTTEYKMFFKNNVARIIIHVLIEFVL